MTSYYQQEWDEWQERRRPDDRDLSEPSSRAHLDPYLLPHPAYLDTYLLPHPVPAQPRGWYGKPLTPAPCDALEPNEAPKVDDALKKALLHLMSELYPSDRGNES